MCHVCVGGFRHNAVAPGAMQGEASLTLSPCHDSFTRTFPDSLDWSTNLGTDTIHGALADTDLDGDLDLLLVQQGSVGIILNRPQPRPVTVPTWTSDDAMSSVDVTVMDLNGDGVNDLVFANEGPSRGYCGLNGGGFNTTPCWETSSLGGLSVTSGDIDQDGDEGPRSPTMCGYVLPPPHLTLIEKRFVEASGNGILDGREHGWAMFKIVNDGRSPAREIKPWLKPLEEGAVTPSLKIDSVAMTPVLNVGDTLQIQFPIYAKLKIESGEKFKGPYSKEYNREEIVGKLHTDALLSDPDKMKQL